MSFGCKFTAPGKLNMSTIKVEVCKILEIKPHENADALHYK